MPSVLPLPRIEDRRAVGPLREIKTIACDRRPRTYAIGAIGREEGVVELNRAGIGSEQFTEVTCEFCRGWHGSCHDLVAVFLDKVFVICEEEQLSRLFWQEFRNEDGTAQVAAELVAMELRLDHWRSP